MCVYVCIIWNCTCNFSLLLLLLLLLRNVDVKTSRTEQTSLFFSLFVLHFLSFLKKKNSTPIQRWDGERDRKSDEYIFSFNTVLWYTKWHRIQAVCAYEHIELIASVLATKSTERRKKRFIGSDCVWWHFIIVCFCLDNKWLWFGTQQQHLFFSSSFLFNEPTTTELITLKKCDFQPIFWHFIDFEWCCLFSNTN